MLKITGLTKRFSGTLALDSVDLEVCSGEVHALLGENGAGKSTLIKVLAGVHKADGGTIEVDGLRVDPTVDDLPINFIHQDLGLVDTMSVAENVAVLAGYPRRAGLISWSAARAAAQRALDAMGGGVDPDARVGSLPAAEKSIVAIARAMATRCNILVLDEPTAALPEADVARLLEVLRRLRAGGTGIIYVTHRLDEVFRIADRVTVLRDGKRVTTAVVADTSPGELVHAIVGRSLSELYVQPTNHAGDVALDVRDFKVGRVGPVSFQVRAGEILALVGLRGAGHTSIGRALFGDLQTDGGSVTLRGASLRVRGPGDAIERRVGFVSSKRGEESLARGLTVRENLFINPVIAGVGLLRPLLPKTERARSLATLRRFSVRPPEPENVIATLSGGNQQKVVVARWLEAGVDLLILEEPTFGVDVGSKAEIYRLLQEALEQGLAVLLISSDFEEVAGISDRAVVMDRGRFVAEISRSDMTIARLTAMTSGAARGDDPARAA